MPEKEKIMKNKPLKAKSQLKNFNLLKERMKISVKNQRTKLRQKRRKPRKRKN